MFRKAIALILVLIFAAGFVFAATDDAQTDVPQTLVEKFSYAFGIYMLVNYGEYALDYLSYYQQAVYPEIDLYYGYMGMVDASQGTLLFSVDELNAFLTQYMTEYEAKMAAQAEENLKIAEDFLKENKTKSGVKVTEMSSGSSMAADSIRTARKSKPRTRRTRKDISLPSPPPRLLPRSVLESRTIAPPLPPPAFPTHFQ